MLLFLPILTFLFIPIHGIPHERSKRLVPPKYLSVDGFQDCLVDYAESTSTHWCFPLSKPKSCSDQAWKELAESYAPKMQSKASLATPPAILGGPETTTPEHLSVANFEDCLNIQYKESHSEYCLPDAKPVNCLDASWEKLQEVFNGDCQPQDFTQVAGYDLCLTPDQGSPFGWCKPKTKPDECLESSWQELQDFKGETCTPQHILIGNDLGALPPKYLFYPDYKNCLSLHQLNPDSHSEYCLPKVKPASCQLSTWTKIRQVFDGIGCPASNSNSDYESIFGWKDCLDVYPGSFCLPRTKLEACPDETWQEILLKFNGISCPPVKIAINGPTGLPPAWLNVQGYQGCLDTYQASPDHSQWCLPLEKPDTCLADAWTSIKDLFDGETCPREKHIFILPVVAETEEIGRPEIVSQVQTVSPPKAEYLKVPDYELCLQIYQVGTSALSEYCLPRSKPNNCPETSWNQLLRVFKGIGCGPSTKRVQVGAPQYLSVPNFRDCLGDHPSPTGSHTELCLPPFKPDSCPMKSWDNLQDDQVFQGVRCAATKINTPQYLLVPNFQDCLETHQSQWCLPAAKPDHCSPESWQQILDTFPGSGCQSDVESNATILGATPPKYLFVANFEDCLGIDESSQSHTVRCLPKSKPDNCPEESWQSLKSDFDGGFCPNPIAHIRGHENCVKSQSQSAQNCVTMEPIEDICEPSIHEKILSHVFQQDSASQRKIIFPSNHRNINPAEEWTELLYCDSLQECVDQTSKTDVKCLEMNVPIAGKRGICTPLKCTEDSHCPKIGDECSSGSLSGVCNTFTQSCNYYNVLVIAGCLTRNSDLDWSTFAFCNTAQDCQDQYPEVETICSTIFSGNVDKNGKEWRGVCAPKVCSDSSDCPTVGDECTDGAVTATCNAGECSYDPFKLIATCITPPRQSDYDWTKFTHCNSAKDCLGTYPDINTQCSRLANPIRDVNGRNWNGVCAPIDCQDESDCITLGDQCQDGALSGSCQDNQCTYDPFMFSAICTSTPTTPTVDWKEFTYCNDAKDCLQSYPDIPTQCSSLATPISRQWNGVCVPLNCNDNCPTVGDECQDGALSGTCQDNQCTYDPFLLIATCVTPPTSQENDGAIKVPENLAKLMEKYDWSVSVPCNEDQECKQSYPDLKTVCTSVADGIESNGILMKGFCTPQDCYHSCPDIGSSCNHGVMSGQCLDYHNQCYYGHKVEKGSWFYCNISW